MYLDLACKQLCFPPRKAINRRNKSTVIISKIVAFRYSTVYKITWLFVFIETLFPHNKRRSSLLIKDRDQIQSSSLIKIFPFSLMATLRNKRKLAAISRETPEGTRSSRAQNALDPDLTQDYISQVSGEIEGRVTKNLSKEFSRTESDISGALSKLD